MLFFQLLFEFRDLFLQQLQMVLHTEQHLSFRVRKLVVSEVDIIFPSADFFAVHADDLAGDTDDRGIRRYFFQNDRARADLRVLTDGERTEDFGTAGYDDIVADGRVTFAFFFACTAMG